jgi:hypothetical protein
MTMPICDRQLSKPHTIRVTQNAVTSFQRRLSPASTISRAYRELRHAVADADYTQHPPTWLRRVRGDADGYLLLDGDLAVLPVRHGRVVACLVNPERAAR